MSQRHIAVTGTKGKTTVTRLIQEIAHEDNIKTYGEFGIDGSFLNGKQIQAEFRSADEYFQNENIKNCDLIISEATSYVLETGCYKDILLDIAIFTGFEEMEHAELYETPEDYLATKKIIFTHIKKDGFAIVNRDSPFYEKIIDGIDANIVTYGETEESDFQITNLTTNIDGSTFTLKGPKSTHTIKTILWGNFNVQNIAASIIGCQLLDINKKTIEKALKKFPGIKGRSNTFHVVETNSLVIIDYAHTPESLKCQLEFLNKNRGSRKIVCVFGCGGMKSQEKRPEMGFIAGHLSDHVILTSDNPRNEHPRQILSDILEGIHNLGSVEVYPDREEAIKRALSSFSNSIILIAGKGAEQFQEIGEYEIPMCDSTTFEKWVIQNGYGIRGYNDYID